MASGIFASYSGTDFIRKTISLFVYLPHGWMQTVSFYIFGFSLLAVAAIFRLKISVRVNVTAMVLVIIAIAFFLVGAFPSHLPGEPATVAGNIHLAASIVIIMAFPFACFFMVPILKARDRLFLYIYTIIAGIFQVLFIFIAGYFIRDLAGLYERLLLANGQMWVIVVCLGLLSSEIKRHLPLRMHRFLTARLSILGLLYVSGAFIWPLCLTLVNFG